MTTTNTFAKIAAVVAGLGLVAMSFVGIVAAPAAHADTTTTTTSSTDLQAQIASLLAQIAALQAQLGTSQGASVTFTRDLTINSTGNDVTALQTWLIGKGFAIPAGATGFFGVQTRAALAAYQAANGISPAAGYFGPITRAKVNATAGTTTTTTTTTGGTTTGSTTTVLSGGEGSIDNFKIIGASSTTLQASDSDTVYGFEFKADGSDLLVNRVDYDVYNSNSNSVGATRPWNVFKTATLMNGNTTIATVDATNMNNWSEDGTAGNGNQIYRFRFDGLNDVVRMGNTVDYYLMLSTQGAISDSNSGGHYAVSLASQGVRAVDAKGIQQYSTSGTSYNTISVTNTTSGSLTLSTGSDNPQVTTVQANSNSQTSDVTLTTFTLQAKDADVNVFTIPVTVATTSANASNIVRSLKLYQGSTLIDTESFASNSGNTITFKNLNVKIPTGSTQSFSVKTDVNAVDGVTVPEGSSISASIPATGFDAENASGDQVTLTGSVTGNVITFRTVGFSVDAAPAAAVWSLSTAGNGTQQTGTYNFVFNVTAFGQDIYVSSSSNGFTPTQVNGTPAGGTGALVATTTAAATISSTADRSTLSNYVVHSGQTKSFTIGFTKQGQNGVAQAVLSTLLFGTADANPLLKTYTLPSTYQSPQQFLAD